MSDASPLTDSAPVAEASPVAVVLGLDLSDAQMDLADRVLELMATKIPSFTWTAAGLASLLGVPAGDLRPVMRFLARHLYVRTHGKGSRERFGRWVKQSR